MWRQVRTPFISAPLILFMMTANGIEVELWLRPLHSLRISQCLVLKLAWPVCWSDHSVPV